MKYALWVGLIIVCFILGRIMYGPLAPALVGDPAGKATGSGDAKEVRVETAGGAMTMIVKLSEIKDEELPEKVTLKKRVKVTAEGQDPIYLEAGAKVLVKGREGNNLVIAAMAGPLEGMTKISSTDLIQQVAKGRVMKMAGGAVAQNDPPQPTPPSPAPPQGGPKPPQGGPKPPQGGPDGGGPKPPPVAQTDPPMNAPPTPEPEPEPEPEPAEAKTLNAEQIVTAMQESVKAGQIKEFKFPQVEGWKAGEDENVDGETYQTGLAAYKAETIFGVKTVQAKALIKNGKVAKWVYAKTGMEIR